MADARLSRLEERVTLQEKVYQALYDAIVQGAYQPGDRLVQDEISASLGVSRMPVREALRQLERDGLVVFEPHRGACVALLDRDRMREVYFLRKQLEPLAVAVAIPRLTDADCDEFEKHLNTFDRALARGNAKAVYQAYRAAHKVIHRVAGMTLLSQFIQRLQDLLPPYRGVKDISERSLREHRRLLEAMRKRDVEGARAAVLAYIQLIEDEATTVSKSLGEPGEGGAKRERL